MNCPSCNFELTRIPKSKTKCKHCGEFIYVRTHYSTKEELYLNEKQKDLFDKERKEFFFYKEWFQRLADLGITRAQIESVQSELRAKWGAPHPSNRDLVWALFTRHVLTLGKHNADFHEYKMLYWNWALFACEIDLDPSQLKLESHKWELLDYKKQGYIKKVSILSNNGCDDCKKLEGKVFDIESVLKDSPLPNKVCTHKLDEEDRFAWCRCIYLPVIEKLN